MKQEKAKIKKVKNQEGFTYIDLMCAVVILMVGMLALTGTLTVNLIRSYETDSHLMAKQFALSTIESVFAVRELETGALGGWEAIGNVGNNPVNGVPKGIFVNGFTPIREDEGPDGVSGTADDACATGTACVSAGHPPNRSAEVPGMLRRVVITNVPNSPGKREIEVTIRYSVSRAFREETMKTMITSYQ